MKHITSIGIIGLGSFGRFVASLIPTDKDLRVYAYDPIAAHLDGVEPADLPTVARADVIILAIPLSAYPAVLGRLQKLIPPETLIIDVCSVKTYPEQYLQKHLPNHPNILLTHPLFGPQSASNGTDGCKLVISKSSGEKADIVAKFCEQSLGLEIQRMSSEEHDRLMAKVHVLTFFVARGLSQLDIEEGPFVTPSYKMIMDLVKFDQTHTDDLFQTIQRGNPFAEEMRNQVIESFTRLEASLKDDKTRSTDVQSD
jgi:prephenate dehydrogenase